MEWKIRFASTLFKKEKTYMTHIDTISDLKILSQTFNARLIIDFINNEIIIYDDYVE